MTLTVHLPVALFFIYFVLYMYCMLLTERSSVFITYCWLHSRVASHCWKRWCFNSRICLFTPWTWWIISSV